MMQHFQIHCLRNAHLLNGEAKAHVDACFLEISHLPFIFQNPNGSLSTGSAWTCSWKPRFGTKPTTNWWAGAREDRWMLKRCHPFDVTCMGVNKKSGLVFLKVLPLQPEAFSLLMEAGAHLSLKDSCCVSVFHYLWDHLQTHFTHFTRWLQSLRFRRWFHLMKLKDSRHLWLVVLEDFGESQRCIREAKDLN